MHTIEAQLNRIEWYAIHNHDLLHEIAADTENMLRMLSKQKRNTNDQRSSKNEIYDIH